jgi:hypothetical protein
LVVKQKQLIDSPEYQSVFKTRLREDSQAAGKWETQGGGEYYAAGVGSAITGRGADLLIIDDPHSEQDAMNRDAMERAYEWYTSGPRQRLQPGGCDCFGYDKMEHKRSNWETVRRAARG